MSYVRFLLAFSAAVVFQALGVDRGHLPLPHPPLVCALYSAGCTGGQNAADPQTFDDEEEEEEDDDTCYAFAVRAPAAHKHKAINTPNAN